MVLSSSPFLILTIQSGRVPVMATSQETAPAGSKYLAVDVKRCTLLPRPRGAFARHLRVDLASPFLPHFAARTFAPWRFSHMSV